MGVRLTTLAAFLVLVGLWSNHGLAAEKSEMATLCESAISRSTALRRACETLLEAGGPPAGARMLLLQQLSRMTLPSPAMERWISIGPAPIVGGSPETTWTARPRSGRVSAVAVDPGDPHHWLIGSAGGGIWETTDSGASWSPRTDFQPALAIGAIAFAPSNPKIVYAGTGEPVFSLDAYGGVGILKSLDGGRTWTYLVESLQYFENRSFSALAVDPASPDIVIATVTKPGRSWVPPSTPPPPGATFPPHPSGIYKSINGGTVWTQTQQGEASDLEVHPINFRLQYAGIGSDVGVAGNGVFRSMNGGDAWNRLSGPDVPWPDTATVGRVEVAIAPSNPNVVYVGIHDASPTPPGNGGGILGLWRTRDAWSTSPIWEAIPLAATDDGSGKLGYCGWNPGVDPRKLAQCAYNHDLSVDRGNPDALYAGGVSLWKYDGTWHELAFHDPAIGIHSDQHAMAWAGNRLIVGNDGGVWSTTNGGASWDDHNMGLGTIQFWGGAVAPGTDLLAVGGTQDNGTAVWTFPASTWTGIIRGDAGAPVISPTSPRTHWGIAGWAKGLEVFRTVNGGTTVDKAGDGLPAAVRKGAGIARPFVGCPGNHDVLLFGEFAPWKTTDFFASRPGQPTWSHNGVEVPTPASGTRPKMTAAAFASSDATCRTYAVAAKGWLRLTADGGGSWRDLDPARTLPQGRVPRGLAFDPRTPDTLFVVYSGFAAGETGRVFRTGAALATVPAWTDVGSGVDIPHNSIAIDPVDPNIVWVGTDLGVLVGTWNGSQMTWRHFGQAAGLPNVAVSDVKLHLPSRRPVAFTHGRGAFVLVNLLEWCAGAWLPGLGTNLGPCIPLRGH
jgi:hypothetical protein